LRIFIDHEETMILDCPVTRVWAIVGDPHEWPAWAPGIGEIETSPAGPLKPGTCMHYRMGSRPVEATITDHVDQRLIGFSTAEARYDFRESIALRPIDARTGVSIRMGFGTRGVLFPILAVLAWPARRWLLGRPLRKDLDALRAAVADRST
jgi:Polyketide cyclase / dehydrase and lipid transport